MLRCRSSFLRRGGAGQSWRLVLGYHCDVFLCVLLTRAAERVFSYMGSKGWASRYNHRCHKWGRRQDQKYAPLEALPPLLRAILVQPRRSYQRHLGSKQRVLDAPPICTILANFGEFTLHAPHHGNTLPVARLKKVEAEKPVLYVGTFWGEWSQWRNRLPQEA